MGLFYNIDQMKKNLEFYVFLFSPKVFKAACVPMGILLFIFFIFF